jgi:hypothetical protein
MGVVWHDNKSDRGVDFAPVTEAFPWDSAPRYLIRDRDTAYGRGLRTALAYHSIRDRPIVFGEPHLRRLGKYVAYLAQLSASADRSHVAQTKEVMLWVHSDLLASTIQRKTAAFSSTCLPPRSLGRAYGLPIMDGRAEWKYMKSHHRRSCERNCLVRECLSTRTPSSAHTVVWVNLHSKIYTRRGTKPTARPRLTRTCASRILLRKVCAPPKVRSQCHAAYAYRSCS